MQCAKFVLLYFCYIHVEEQQTYDLLFAIPYIWFRSHTSSAYRACLNFYTCLSFCECGQKQRVATCRKRGVYKGTSFPA